MVWLLLWLMSCGSPESRRNEVLVQAEIARSSGDLIRAEQILSRAHERGPEDQAIAMRLAEVLVQRGDNRRALDLVRTLPERPEQLRMRGRLAAEAGRHDEAIEAIRKLYRSGHARDPEIMIILRLLSDSQAPSAPLEALLRELAAEGDTELMRAWIEALPPNHGSLPYLRAAHELHRTHVQ